MLYRAVLVVLLLVALALTFNERWQEQRAHALAEQTGQPAGASVAALAAPTPRPPAAPRSVVPFVPHRVRLRQEVELLQAPEPMARPVEPANKVPPGILVQAIDERNGWYLVDTNLNRGWAPTDLFDEP